MRPEIIKKMQEEADRHDESVQIPLRIPLPEYQDMEEEEVSVVSNVIVIDL
jgi:hypothetical protein